jgi:hypothetical protein
VTSRKCHSEFFGEMPLCYDPESPVYDMKACRLIRAGTPGGTWPFVRIVISTAPDRGGLGAERPGVSRTGRVDLQVADVRVAGRTAVGAGFALLGLADERGRQGR